MQPPGQQGDPKPDKNAGLSQTPQLLTTQVHVRVMHECAAFARTYVGVTRYFTSRYDDTRQVCVSLYDQVAACDGDRYELGRGGEGRGFCVLQRMEESAASCEGTAVRGSGREGQTVLVGASPPHLSVPTSFFSDHAIQASPRSGQMSSHAGGRAGSDFLVAHPSSPSLLPQAPRPTSFMVS